jgi:hypothetical protein
MRKAIVVTVIFVLAIPWLLVGQVIQKVVPIKNLTAGDSFNRMVNLLGTFRGPKLSFSADPVLRLIAINGEPEAVSALEQVIKTLDVPPAVTQQQNVEVTAYLVIASPQAGPSKVPQDLESVVKQVKSVFPYQSYQTLETILLRVRNGQNGFTSGNAPAPGLTGENEQRSSYEFRFQSVGVTSSDKVRSVRIDGLNLQLRVPYRQVWTADDGVKKERFSSRDTRINTDIDLREGQKVVVGKSNIDGSDNALILVLTARVVE